MSTPIPVAVITGSAHGLGLEVARQLTDAGIHAVLSSRRASAAAERARELGVSALEVDLDVADRASVDAAAEEVRRRFQRVDVLINNAAAYVDWSETGLDSDLDQARQVLDTNLFGAWNVIQAFWPLLRQSPSPRIVNISSGAGSHGDPGFGLAARGGAAATYGISKAALNALTTTLAAQTEDTALLVNSVCPGLTATYPGAEEMGARPVAESAQGVAWAATLPDDGPNGGFFRDGHSLPW